jgi:ribonuclease P protein component
VKTNTSRKLTKSRRLCCSEDFSRVFRKGVKLKQGCVITYTKNNGLDYARLGLAITKKNIPNATSRNRIKRIIRETFRLNQHLLSGIDIVTAVTKQCLSNKQVLSSDLDKQCARLMIYYKRS